MTMESEAARQPRPPAAAPPTQRTSIHGGRFARWHQESTPPAEEEAWLLTYLDVMTLLLVMMVVILAFSEPVSKPRGEGAAATASTGPTVVAPAPASEPSAVSPNSPSTETNEPPPDPLDSLPLKALGDNVEVIKVGNTLRFRIRSELLFASGDAGLTPEGRLLVDSLLPIFNVAVNHTIVVEGHTDNTPINTPRFPSNWELAAGRAGSVVRHLESRGINPTRLRATAYGETHPIAPNTTAQGQSANRRVELILALPTD